MMANNIPPAPYAAKHAVSDGAGIGLVALGIGLIEKGETVMGCGLVLVGLGVSFARHYFW